MNDPLLRALPLPIALLAIAAGATAQAASYAFSGVPATYGCSPANSAVTHTAVGTPVRGTTFIVQVPMSFGPCSYLCNWNVLATGVSDTQFQGVPLPWPLVPTWGLSVCGQLRVSLDVLEPIPFAATPGGVHSVPLVIPAATSLTGFTFYQQLISMQFVLGGLNVTAFGRKGTGVIGA